MFNRLHFLHTLWGKLLLMSLALTLIPALLLSGFFFLSAQAAFQEAALDAMTHDAQVQANAVAEWLNERRMDVETVAQDPRLVAVDVAAAQAALEGYLARWPFYETLYMTDNQGLIIANPDQLFIDVADRPYTAAALQGKAFILDKPVPSKKSGDIIVAVSAPVRNPAGDIVGAVIGIVPVKSIAQTLTAMHVGETGDAYIIDADGYVVTAPRFADELVATGLVEEHTETQYRVETVAAQQVLTGAAGADVYANYTGQEVLGAYAPVTGLGWGILVEQQTREAYAVINNLRQIGVIVLLVLVPLAAVVAYYFSRSITRPIQAMSAASQRIARGEVEQEVTHRSRDEIGQLADQFRQMIGYQRDMAQAAKLLAQGDLTAQVAPQSEKDLLGNAFQEMVIYQKQIADAARQLARGNLAVKITPKSEQDVLGNAFQHMVAYQREVSGVVARVATGDLTVDLRPISEQDVLGASVQKMIAHLRKTVGSVRLNAGRLLSASQYLSTNTQQANSTSAEIAQTIELMAETTQQVAQTIGQVALGASQQAQVMEQSRHIMEDQDRLIADIAQGALQQSQAIEAADHVFHGRLAAAIQQVENTTISSDYAVDTASQAARSGASAIEKTITGFGTVAKTAEQVTHRITEMGRRSDQIGAIVQVINDIAERTNLLSLNAAIEAARAGEHGKGFAVVADEVRKLADRSAKSAEEISQLVVTVQDAANQAVAAMQENDRQVQQGLSTASDAEQALAGILTSMAQVSTQMKQLQGAVADLSGSSQQVQDAMQQVAGVIEENLNATSALTAGQRPLQQSMEEIASVAEENSAAAEEVAASAEENSTSVDEISAMTRNVNIQIEQMHDAVQSLAAMSAALQEIVATFQVKDSGMGSGMDSSRGAADVSPAYASAAVGAENNMVSLPTAATTTARQPGPGASTGKRKAAFVWDESMATGDDKVDEQHRKLFEMTNGLIQAMAEGRGRRQIAEVLDQLTAYTVTHFAWEEGCMEQHRCPVAEVNKTAHARFVQMVAETRQRFEVEGPSTELVLAIKENLGDWLVKHIRRIDTQLRGCVHDGEKATVAR